MTIAGKIRAAAQAFRRSSQQVGKDIDSVREQIVENRARREEIARLPVTKEAALARLEEWIGSLLTNKRSGVDHLVAAMTAPGQRPAPDFLRNAADDIARIEWVLADRIRDLVGAALGNFYSERQGIDDAERERQLAKLDDDILDLELCEESIIRAAQEAGMKIPRRPDADPRAVLASDQDLPQ